MSIRDEKYISFTTFRKTGVPVSSPVWLVPLEDGRFGFWTMSTSGKAKRLRNNPSVTLQPCDGMGKVKEGSDVVSATAVALQSGPEFDEIHAKIKAKYGFMTKITKALAKIAGVFKRQQMPYADTAIVITLA